MTQHSKQHMSTNSSEIEFAYLSVCVHQRWWSATDDVMKCCQNFWIGQALGCRVWVKGPYQEVKGVKGYKGSGVVQDWGPVVQGSVDVRSV